ncbi:MAG: extracellular solute-binding protein [Patescibacteria group bacterium]
MISKFQLITLATFVVFIIAGVAAFALYRGEDSATQLPSISMWGTFPKNTFDQHVAEINKTLVQPIIVEYTQKDPNKFSSEFIAALARGQGPDAILIPADTLYPHSDKLALVPYTALSQRDFRDTFVREAEVYLFDQGVAAIPFTLDPLIMYWNRDMFDTAGIPTYPRYWDEFVALNERLTIKDANGNVRRSAIAMGDFTNVTNAREILGTLLFQVGNPVTLRDKEGMLNSTLTRVHPASPGPALEFFTQFVNPSDPNYSWNRGMPQSKSAFLSASLATYFGFASELFDLRTKNPNLNFDAALIPQLRTDGIKATYARMYGFSIVRTTASPNAVYQIVSLLTAPSMLAQLSQTMYLPPVRRDLIAQGSADPYITNFGEAALVSQMWLDVDPQKSNQILADMVGSITSGRKTLLEAIQDAGDQYDIVLQQAGQ